MYGEKEVSGGNPVKSTLNIGSAFSWKTLLDLPCPDRGFNITSTFCVDLHLIGGWSNKDSLRGLSESWLILDAPGRGSKLTYMLCSAKHVTHKMASSKVEATKQKSFWTLRVFPNKDFLFGYACTVKCLTPELYDTCQDVNEHKISVKWCNRAN